VTESDLAQQLGSGELPAEALVWLPGQRCWASVVTLPGYRAAPDAASGPVGPVLTPGSRIPPTVVLAGVAELPTAERQPIPPQTVVPEQVHSDITDVTGPRVVLSGETTSYRHAAPPLVASAASGRA
jgi:hypothetical protein